ncbi:MAG: helix-turn-helix domain-containing protein [Verrucomicrobia bacterium]|nr:helix-turn-helix domain-containing protein [Cytophagales bacterium]
MAAEIITKEDLIQFKTELLSEVKSLVTTHLQPPRKWLRSPEVRKLLNISNGTLANLRVSGALPYSRLDGIFYYPYDEILKNLEQNRNLQP